MIRRIVIKLGTSVLTGGAAHLDRAHMVELVRQAALLHREGLEVVLCSSGAIAAGRARMHGREVTGSLASKQMLAALGQSRLMRHWEELFDLYGIDVGQVLLTRADVQDRGRFLNARDTLTALLEHRIVPIVNENDAVATAEIKLGDNDTLSALLALLVEADLLVLLTDQPGLFTADPRTDPGAELIDHIETIDASLRALAGDSVSGQGVGGMATKLQAAELARRSGVHVVIAAGHAPDVLGRIVRGEPVGTRFPPLAHPLDSRKRWILAGTVPGGQIRVDSGAAAALLRRQASLLPAGIEAVEGPFTRGDTVRILDPTGTPLGRGISRYDAADLDRIRGCRSDAIAEVLGYAYGPVAIHRDDLILLHPDGAPPPDRRESSQTRTAP